MWVTISKAAEVTGYSEAAIRKKISRGVWPEGKVWTYAPDKRILVNLEGYKAWAETEVTSSQPATPRLKLDPPNEVSGAANGSR